MESSLYMMSASGAGSPNSPDRPPIVEGYVFGAAILKHIWAPETSTYNDQRKRHATGRILQQPTVVHSRMPMVGTARGRHEGISGGFGPDRKRKSRICMIFRSLGADVGCGAEFIVPDAIRRVASGTVSRREH